LATAENLIFVRGGLSPEEFGLLLLVKELVKEEV
jgi:hypothetical protein